MSTEEGETTTATMIATAAAPAETSSEAATAAPASANSSPTRAKHSPSPAKRSPSPAKRPPPPPQEEDEEEGAAATAGGGSASKRVRQAGPKKAALKEDEGPEPGSYWQVGEGQKRARKAVETLTVVDHREGKEVVIQEGKGTALGEMEGVVEAMKKVVSKDPLLKKLHSMCFGKPGKAQEVKKNLLQFSGLTYGEGDEEVGRAKVEDKARGMQSAELKTACDLLGVNRSGKNTKEDLVQTLVDWLEAPADIGKAHKAAKAAAKREQKAAKLAKKKEKAEKAKKAKAKKSSKAAAKGAKKAAATGTKKKKAKLFSASADMLSKKKKAGAAEGAEAEAEDELEISESEQEEQEEQEEAKAKKPKAKPAKKQQEVVDSDDKDEAEEGEDEEDEMEVSDDDDEEEEEEEASGSGSGSGSGEGEEEGADALEAAVRAIVAEADINTLTIKTIMGQLEEKLGRDVSERKPRVKEIVTEILAG